MKKLSPIVQHLRTFAVVPTYLGRYTTELDTTTVPPTRGLVRDGWQTGEVFQSQDGKHKYAVAQSGNLVLV